MHRPLLQFNLSLPVNGDHSFTLCPKYLSNDTKVSTAKVNIYEVSSAGSSVIHAHEMLNESQKLMAGEIVGRFKVSFAGQGLGRD